MTVQFSLEKDNHLAEEVTTFVDSFNKVVREEEQIQDILKFSLKNFVNMSESDFILDMSPIVFEEIACSLSILRVNKISFNPIKMVVRKDKKDGQEVETTHFVQPNYTYSCDNLYEGFLKKENGIYKRANIVPLFYPNVMESLLVSKDNDYKDTSEDDGWNKFFYILKRNSNNPTSILNLSDTEKTKEFMKNFM